MLTNEQLLGKVDTEVKRKYDIGCLAPMTGSQLDGGWVRTIDGKWIIMVFDAHKEPVMSPKYCYLVGLIEEACVFIRFYENTLMTSVLLSYPSIPSGLVFPISNYKGAWAIRHDLLEFMVGSFAGQVLSDLNVSQSFVTMQPQPAVATSQADPFFTVTQSQPQRQQVPIR